jgi:hypothetical protein
MAPIVFSNCGTLKRRFRKTKDAWSSNLPSSAHSMRISCGVSTVKRAWPTVTTASGRATGSVTSPAAWGWVAGLEGVTDALGFAGGAARRGAVCAVEPRLSPTVSGIAANGAKEIRKSFLPVFCFNGKGIIADYAQPEVPLDAAILPESHWLRDFDGSFRLVEKAGTGIVTGVRPGPPFAPWCGPHSAFRDLPILLEGGARVAFPSRRPIRRASMDSTFIKMSRLQLISPARRVRNKHFFLHVTSRIVQTRDRAVTRSEHHHTIQEWRNRRPPPRTA